MLQSAQSGLAGSIRRAVDRADLVPDVVPDEEGGEPVRLCLLGGFRLLCYGQPVAVRSGGRTEALLAHLGLAARQGVPREALLCALWPDSAPALAGQALNSLVYSLRGLLGDALGGATPVMQSAGYYRLNEAAGVGVDVARFDALVAAGERYQRAGQPDAAAALYERAVRLYRGDLVTLGDGGGQAIMERERLRAVCLTLLARLSGHSFARGDFGACLAQALRLLALDPCREDAHRLVMRCHVRRGERAQALRQYGIARAILRAEFDAEPEPATIALFEQVRLDPGAV
jgi:DNA-binding SARP family transcriptional activator